MRPSPADQDPEVQLIRRLEADTRQLLEETSRKLSSLTEQRRFRESRVNRDAPIPEPYPCAGYSSNGPDTVGDCPKRDTCRRHDGYWHGGPSIQPRFDWNGPECQDWAPL